MEEENEVPGDLGDFFVRELDLRTFHWVKIKKFVNISFALTFTCFNIIKKSSASSAEEVVAYKGHDIHNGNVFTVITIVGF